MDKKAMGRVLLVDGVNYLYAANDRNCGQEILLNVMEAGERQRGGFQRDSQITVTLAR